LTAFGYLKQASNFVEITNIAAVGITQVEIVAPVGMGFTGEGSENVIDAGDVTVPTLSGWGAIFAARRPPDHDLLAAPEADAHAAGLMPRDDRRAFNGRRRLSPG
jgi:hypothetical protein